jgi:AcrR family transcriptional regulator
MLDSAISDLAETPGRRERKKRATRLALKSAALNLVAERGYGNVTVEDIANEVDVSERTFFNYFASKDAAIVGEDPELADALRDGLFAISNNVAPFEALRTVLLDRIEATGEDIDLSSEDHVTWQRRFAVVRSQPEVLLAYAKHLANLEDSITEALLEWMGGDEELRTYASLVSSSALGILRVAGAYWGGEGGSKTLTEYVNAAFDLLGQGLANFPSKKDIPEGLFSLSSSRPSEVKVAP